MTAPRQRIGWSSVKAAFSSGAVLTVACLLSYWSATALLGWADPGSRADQLLGGMWAADYAARRIRRPAAAVSVRASKHRHP